MSKWMSELSLQWKKKHFENENMRDENRYCTDIRECFILELNDLKLLTLISLYPIMPRSFPTLKHQFDMSIPNYKFMGGKVSFF